MVGSGVAAQRLTHESVEDSDGAITMGCGETCPVFPGKRYEDWAVEDPKGQDLETVRRIARRACAGCWRTLVSR